jgi:hypothetical protein
VVGLLVDGRERFEASATTREWLKQRGLAHLKGNAWEQAAPL